MRTLQIRDPRAHNLARQLAASRHVTMTEAVILALEGELKREAEKKPVWETVQEIAAELKALGKPGGRDMTKDEIAEMWGHE